MDFRLLYIDNSQEEVASLGMVKDEGGFFLREYNNKTRRPLLYFVDKFLSGKKMSWTQIKGLAVRVGVGRFTATRIAVTVANTLSLTCNIPVIAVSDFNPKEIVKKISRSSSTTYVSAKYSGTARIGQ